MIGLKLRRNRETADVNQARSTWPIVGGEQVEPYELPEDPMGDAAQLAYMEERAARLAAQRRTQESRGLRAVADGVRAAKGRGFERVLFRRWTLEYHRLPPGLDGERFRFGLYRRDRPFGKPPRRWWELTVEFRRDKR